MRTRPCSPDGFTIIEVVVAMTVLMTALVGAALLFENAVIISGNTRNRVVAQQLASQALEKIRGKAADPTKFTSIVSTGTTTQSVNGFKFTVQETIDFVNVGSTQSSCDSPGTNNGLVMRAREKVTWTGMAGTAAVRENTILAAPVGAYNSASGGVAAKVFDSTGAVASGVTVQVAGPSTSQQQTTPEGCAFFPYLAPGTYTVSIIAGTGVGDQENVTPSQTASVSVGQTASLQFNYDTAATINWSSWTNSAATPPAGMPLSVANSGLQPYSQYSFASGITSLTPLYPYASGYTVFAGNCTDNNPLGKDTSRNLFYPTLTPAPVSVTPGGTATATVPLYTVPVIVKDGANAVQVGATVTGTATGTFPLPNGLYTSVCTSGAGTGVQPTLSMVTTDATGVSTTAMPLGHWTIRAVKGAKSGQINIWVKPDGNYNVSGSTGLATTLIAGNVTVVVS